MVGVGSSSLLAPTKLYTNIPAESGDIYFGKSGPARHCERSAAISRRGSSRYEITAPRSQ